MNIKFLVALAERLMVSTDPAIVAIGDGMLAALVERELKLVALDTTLRDLDECLGKLGASA